MIDGYVKPGFERVRDAFATNFGERGEVGGAVRVTWTSEKMSAAVGSPAAQSR